MLISEEDPVVLNQLGKKIIQMRRLNREIVDFFIQEDKGKYEGTDEILVAIHQFVKGESASYIADTVFQSDEEPVIELLGLFGIKKKPDVKTEKKE